MEFPTFDAAELQVGLVLSPDFDAGPKKLSDSFPSAHIGSADIWLSPAQVFETLLRNKHC